MIKGSLKRRTTPSRENYLKTILGLSGEVCIRSIDIANALGVSKASVSNMMAVLMEEGYVTKEKHGPIHLTESGRCVAVRVKKKYELFKNFLHHVLGVEASIAAEDACRMEHLISAETTERISRQLESLSECLDEAEFL
ncbi:MAG: metal-dependent transcriptional regulator [Christensenellales bacterium]|jgi:DtxR family Mn-dependent transcriptional regulator